MTDIQDALGCAQMDRAAWILDIRSQRAQRYDQLLTKVEWLETPRIPDGFVHGYQAYVCLFCPEEPTLNNVDPLHQQRNELMMQQEPNTPCLLYTSPSPRDRTRSRMPSSA